MLENSVDIGRVTREVGAGQFVGFTRTATEMGNRDHPVLLPEIMANGTGIMALAAAFQTVKQDQGGRCVRLAAWVRALSFPVDCRGSGHIVSRDKRMLAGNIPVDVNEIIIGGNDSFTGIEDRGPGHEPGCKNGLRLSVG